MIQLLASDIDGTLLGDNDLPSARSLDALAAAKAAGWVIVLATGRPPRYLDQAATSLGLGGLAICNNGATLYDPTERRIISDIGVAQDVALEVVAQLRDRIDGLLFAVDHGLELAADAEFVEGTPWFIPPDARIGPPEEVIIGPVSKILARHRELTSSALAGLTSPFLSGLVEVTSSTGSGVIEITAPGVSKGAAVAEFAAGLGVGPEGVVAFGDMPNDTDMLLWAGLGVAMANAHPSILELADEVTASNNDDGVAVVVERLLNERLLNDQVA